ncbi:MAG TPA: antibiotic biosynthesis monooxygenase [Paraburkholderia sp.]|uniref:antibiotic biosynthesis monooxygenase family protein n=1 Tax=Paraburkholderia sp. TaxID=1926495 RepID=UPI002B467760|nr:antibiotic biosynthesis monooxygenase [Paraburkholderia sp.]HKR47385.1 antibiotic biosynthesis monooxygenase [Paraburkholderia sp.]
MTIEIVHKFDVLANADRQGYAELMKKIVEALLRAPGLVEIRANRNLLGSPEVRATSVWERLADWEAARESEPLTALDAESRRYVGNMSIELWEPSNLLPQPVRPERLAR